MRASVRRDGGPDLRRPPRRPRRRWRRCSQPPCFCTSRMHGVLPVEARERADLLERRPRRRRPRRGAPARRREATPPPRRAAPSSERNLPRVFTFISVAPAVDAARRGGRSSPRRAAARDRRATARAPRGGRGSTSRCTSRSSPPHDVTAATPSSPRARLRSRPRPARRVSAGSGPESAKVTTGIAVSRSAG